MQWWPAAAGAAAVLIIWLGFLAFRNRAAPDNGAAEAPRGPGTLVMSPDVMPRGRVDIAGDLVIRSSDRDRRGRAAELDVPTQDVDSILTALQTAGFDVRDTGLTVDTDEGEETLTTIELDLETMAKAQGPGHPDDVLAVSGDLIVEAGVRLSCNLEVGGNATLHDQIILSGGLDAKGAVYIGQRCRILGDVQSAGDVHVGAGSVARLIHAARDVHLAEVRQDTMQRVQARRVHVAADLRPRP